MLTRAYTGGDKGAVPPRPVKGVVAPPKTLSHFSNLKLKSEEHKKFVSCSFSMHFEDFTRGPESP